MLQIVNTIFAAIKKLSPEVNNESSIDDNKSTLYCTIDILRVLDQNGIS